MRMNLPVIYLASIAFSCISSISVTTNTLSSVSFQNTNFAVAIGATSNGNGFLCDKDSGECLLLLNGQVSPSQSFEWKTSNSYQGGMSPLDSMDCWAPDYINPTHTQCIFTSDSKFFTLSINNASQVSFVSQINLPLPRSPFNTPFNFIEIECVEFTNFVYAAPKKNDNFQLLRLDISDGSNLLIIAKEFNTLILNSTKLYFNRQTPYLLLYDNQLYHAMLDWTQNEFLYTNFRGVSSTKSIIVPIDLDSKFDDKQFLRVINSEKRGYLTNQLDETFLRFPLNNSYEIIYGAAVKESKYCMIFSKFDVIILSPIEALDADKIVGVISLSNNNLNWIKDNDFKIRYFEIQEMKMKEIIFGTDICHEKCTDGCTRGLSLEHCNTPVALRTGQKEFNEFQVKIEKHSKTEFGSLVAENTQDTVQISFQLVLEFDRFNAREALLALDTTSDEDVVSVNYSQVCLNATCKSHGLNGIFDIDCNEPDTSPSQILCAIGHNFGIQIFKKENSDLIPINNLQGDNESNLNRNHYQTVSFITRTNFVIGFGLNTALFDVTDPKKYRKPSINPLVNQLYFMKSAHQDQTIYVGLLTIKGFKAHLIDFTKLEVLKQINLSLSDFYTRLYSSISFSRDTNLCELRLVKDQKYGFETYIWNYCDGNNESKRNIQLKGGSWFHYSDSLYFSAWGHHEDMDDGISYLWTEIWDWKKSVLVKLGYINLGSKSLRPKIMRPYKFPSDKWLVYDAGTVGSFTLSTENNNQFCAEPCQGGCTAPFSITSCTNCKFTSKNFGNKMTCLPENYENISSDKKLNSSIIFGVDQNNVKESLSGKQLLSNTIKIYEYSDKKDSDKFEVTKDYIIVKKANGRNYFNLKKNGGTTLNKVVIESEDPDFVEFLSSSYKNYLTCYYIKNMCFGGDFNNLVIIDLSKNKSKYYPINSLPKTAYIRRITFIIDSNSYLLNADLTNLILYDLSLEKIRNIDISTNLINLGVDIDFIAIENTPFLLATAKADIEMIDFSINKIIYSNAKIAFHSEFKSLDRLSGLFFNQKPEKYMIISQISNSWVVFYNYAEQTDYGYYDFENEKSYLFQMLLVPKSNFLILNYSAEYNFFIRIFEVNDNFFSGGKKQQSYSFILSTGMILRNPYDTIIPPKGQSNLRFNEDEPWKLTYSSVPYINTSEIIGICHELCFSECTKSFSADHCIGTPRCSQDADEIGGICQKKQVMKKPKFELLWKYFNLEPCPADNYRVRMFQDPCASGCSIPTAYYDSANGICIDYLKQCNKVENDECVECNEGYSLKPGFKDKKICNPNKIENTENKKKEEKKKEKDIINDPTCKVENCKTCSVNKKICFKCSETFFRDKLKNKCLKVESIDENKGIDKKHNTIKFCLNDSCKNCKKNYQICEDKEFKDYQFLSSGVVDFQKTSAKSFDSVISTASFMSWGQAEFLLNYVQRVKILINLRFLNKNFGIKLESFMYNLRGLFREKLENNKDSFVRLAKSHSGKITKNEIEILATEILNWKLWTYLTTFSWLLVLRYLILNRKRQKEDFNKLLNIYNWSINFHFCLFHSYFYEFSFFLTTTLSQAKFLTSSISLRERLAIMFSYLGFFCLIADLIFILSWYQKFGYYMKRAIKLSKCKENKNFYEELKLKEKELERVNFKTNLNYSKYTSKSILKLLNPFIEKGKISTSKLLNSYKAITLIRILVYNIVISSLQQLPNLNLILIILLEIFMIITSVLTLVYNYNIISYKITFVNQIFQGGCLTLFSILMLFFAEKDSGPGSSVQIICIVLLSLIIIMENITLIFYVAFGINNFLKSKNKNKEFGKDKFLTNYLIFETYQSIHNNSAENLSFKIPNKELPLQATNGIRKNEQTIKEDDNEEKKAENKVKRTKDDNMLIVRRYGVNKIHIKQGRPKAIKKGEKDLKKQAGNRDFKFKKNRRRPKIDEKSNRKELEEDMQL